MSSPPDHTPGPVQLRVSDDEREAQALLLRGHAAEGRLTLEELEERLELAYTARTQDELAALLRDLPATATMAPAVVGEQRHVRDELAAFVVVNLVLIGIWAATGAGYFWPIWPLLGWGLGLVSRAHKGGCSGLRVTHRGQLNT